MSINFGIIIPCYNEEKNIVSLISKIKKSSKPKFVVLIDDSKKSMKSYLPKKNIIYIHRKKKTWQRISSNFRNENINKEENKNFY